MLNLVKLCDFFRIKFFMNSKGNKKSNRFEFLFQFCKYLFGLVGRVIFFWGGFSFFSCKMIRVWIRLDLVYKTFIGCFLLNFVLSIGDIEMIMI